MSVDEVIPVYAKAEFLVYPMEILEYFLKEYKMVKVKSQDILKQSIQILNH